LVGTFHQPSLVLADVGVLETLPPRELLAGYAETVKYGLIDDVDFFEWLEKHAEAFCAGDRAVRTQAVHHACAAKADVVAEDERETGRRALLNLGHTFAHSFEAETGYSDRLLHGEAVAIGMVMAMDLSAAMGLCPVEDAERARRHIAARGLPVDLSGLADASWTAEKLIAHMTSDKKVSGKRATFILSRGIGKAFTTQDVAPDFLHRFLEKCLES
jgi:3-dehydroquinate synthase